MLWPPTVQSKLKLRRLDALDSATRSARGQGPGRLLAHAVLSLEAPLSVAAACRRAGAPRACMFRMKHVGLQ